MIIRKLTFRIINWISRTFFASRLSYSHIQAFLFNNSPRKLQNLALVVWETWRGTEIVRSKPYILILEVTNVCNLKCPFCLTGKGISGGRTTRHMSYEESKRVIDAVADTTYLLQLYTWGEPLLNKDLMDIVTYAKQKNIYVMLSTNATAMNDANNRRLIESGIDYVMVAIDGASPETYSQYRRGGDYQRVDENVRNFLSRRAERKSEKPFVEWQFIVFRHNQHEVESAEATAYAIGINKFTPLPAYVEDESWLPTRKEFRKTTLYNPERLVNCDRPWSHLNIRADGGVASCCYEFFKKDDFGNIFEKNFDEIWNNDYFRESRKLIRLYRKHGPDGLPDSSIICHGCLKSGVRPSFVETPTITQHDPKNPGDRNSNHPTDGGTVGTVVFHASKQPRSSKTSR